MLNVEKSVITGIPQLSIVPNNALILSSSAVGINMGQDQEVAACK